MSTETEVSNEANVLPITILPELEALLPALMPDEKEELRRSIETEGVRDNLLIWRTVREGGEECRILIDGHNRYGITEAMGRPLSALPVADIVFAGIEEAKQWIIVNQLMRRNLTDAQRRDFRGRAYGDAKGTHGGDRKSSDQSDHLKTAEKLATKFGVSEKTLRRDEIFSKRVAALPPEEKAEVLASRKKLPMTPAPKKATAQPAKADKPEAIDWLEDAATGDEALCEVISGGLGGLVSFMAAHNLTKNLRRSLDDLIRIVTTAPCTLSREEAEKLIVDCGLEELRAAIMAKSQPAKIVEPAKVVEPEEAAPEEPEPRSVIDDDDDDDAIEDETVNSEEAPAAPKIRLVGRLTEGCQVLTLRVIDGPSKGRAIRLADGVALIGDGMEAHFELTGPGVTPTHAILRNLQNEGKPVLHVFKVESEGMLITKEPLEIIDVTEDGFTIGENRIAVEFSSQGAAHRGDTEASDLAAAADF